MLSRRESAGFEIEEQLKHAAVVGCGAADEFHVRLFGRAAFAGDGRYEAEVLERDADEEEGDAVGVRRTDLHVALRDVSSLAGGERIWVVIAAARADDQSPVARLGGDDGTNDRRS